MAGLSLSPISLAVFATQLRHGSVAVAYSGDLSLAAGHRAGRPRRPQTPASVLPNWDEPTDLLAREHRHVSCAQNKHIGHASLLYDASDYNLGLISISLYVITSFLLSLLLLILRCICYSPLFASLYYCYSALTVQFPPYRKNKGLSHLISRSRSLCWNSSSA